MIRFVCPTCKCLLDSPDHKAGKKVTCPNTKCRQRLQVPALTAPIARNRTVLGSLVGVLKRQKPKPATKVQRNSCRPLAARSPSLAPAVAG